MRNGSGRHEGNKKKSIDKPQRKLMIEINAGDYDFELLKRSKCGRDAISALKNEELDELLRGIGHKPKFYNVLKCGDAFSISLNPVEGGRDLTLAVKRWVVRGLTVPAAERKVLCDACIGAKARYSISGRRRTTDIQAANALFDRLASIFLSA